MMTMRSKTPPPPSNNRNMSSSSSSSSGQIEMHLDPKEQPLPSREVEELSSQESQRNPEQLQAQEQEQSQQSEHLLEQPHEQSQSQQSQQQSPQHFNQQQQQPEQEQRTQSLSFGSLTIREYNQTNGDQPCMFGPPLGLGWMYNEIEVPGGVEAYEKGGMLLDPNDRTTIAGNAATTTTTTTTPRQMTRRFGQALKMPASVRIHKLRHDWDWTPAQIQKVTATSRRAMNGRLRTANQTPAQYAVAYALENIFSVRRNRLRSGRHHTNNPQGLYVIPHYKKQTTKTMTHCNCTTTTPKAIATAAAAAAPTTSIRGILKKNKEAMPLPKKTMMTIPQTQSQRAPVRTFSVDTLDTTISSTLSSSLSSRSWGSSMQHRKQQPQDPEQLHQDDSISTLGSRSCSSLIIVEETTRKENHRQKQPEPEDQELLHPDESLTTLLGVVGNSSIILEQKIDKENHQAQKAATTSAVEENDDGDGDNSDDNDDGSNKDLLFFLPEIDHDALLALEHELLKDQQDRLYDFDEIFELLLSSKPQQPQQLQIDEQDIALCIIQHELLKDQENRLYSI